MKKSILIAYSNIRKAKAQTVAMIVLLLLAAFTLNIGLMLATDYKQNFDRYHDKLNAEHVTMGFYAAYDTEFQEYIETILENNSQITQYQISDALIMVGNLPYKEGKINSQFIFLEKGSALNRHVGRIEIVEDSEYKSGVYIPMVYGDDIAIGETLDFTIGSNVESFTVCGYLNSVMAGTSNCAMVEFMLTEDTYEELAKTGYAVKSTLVSVRIDDKSQSENLEAELKNAVSSEYPDVLAFSNSYALVSTSRYISQMIASSMVIAMSFLVTMIALVVIASNVVNYIQENMKNLGVLKAVGYKSGQIIVALLYQFAGITLISAVVGAGFSYSLYPSINTMMVAQTGIPYEIRFLPLPFMLSILIIVGAVSIAVWLSARKIKTLEPIVALRAGVQTHNFKKNHVPLDKTHTPLNLALALKTTFSRGKQNITVYITMFVLSLVVVFSGVMIENVIVDIQPFIDFIVGETADAGINVNTVIEDEFLQTMLADERVEKIYLYNSMEVRHGDSVALMATMSEDFSAVNNQNVCFEGRFPKYDNEVALAAKYAKENGFNIGDEITLTAGGNEATYIITGYTQVTNNLGKDCLLTREGYERMGELQNVSYYINTVEGVNVGEFNEEVAKEFGSDINITVDIASVLTVAQVYVTLMTAIVIAVIILSLIVITFVLYLLVRTMLNGKKQDYGIMKALGFTTGQLILQTALSFMPAVIISTVIGITISGFIINPLLSLFLSGLGIVKCSFVIPVGFITVAGIGLILFTFAMACLLSIKIRKIAPRKLLVGE